MFKNNRVEFDLVLLKKLLDREVIVFFVLLFVSNIVRVRLIDEELYGGNLIFSKGLLRVVVEEENDLKYEFVIEDVIVLDMLIILKECFMELNMVKFNELKKGLLFFLFY